MRPAGKPDRREHPLEGLEEIFDLILQHVHRVEVSIEVVIGGAEQRESGVRHHQQVAPVDRLGTDREVEMRCGYTIWIPLAARSSLAPRPHALMSG